MRNTHFPYIGILISWLVLWIVKILQKYLDTNNYLFSNMDSKEFIHKKLVAL